MLHTVTNSNIGTNKISALASCDGQSTNEKADGDLKRDVDALIITMPVPQILNLKGINFYLFLW